MSIDESDSANLELQFDSSIHIQILEHALRAYAYYWPIRRPHGRGQAEGIAQCGHSAWVGAPCCRKCAMKLIEAALSASGAKL